jgi:uncharacterized membrane protein/cytochrome c5
MIKSIYQIMVSIGYTHPLHPALTHIPVGLVIGAWLFYLCAILFKKETWGRTAHHCGALALIGTIPTIIAGILDWQQFYAGVMLTPIKIKLCLAFLLIILLIIFVLSRSGSTLFSFLSLTCALITVVFIGYFGGELVYGPQNAKISTQKEVTPLVAQGATIFSQNCSGCHYNDSNETKFGPGLKGIGKWEKLQVSGWPATEDNIRKQIISPYNQMPAFDQLKKEELDAIIAYLKTL